MSKRYTIRARILPDGHPMTIVGRDADTLQKLIEAGPRGLTPIEYTAHRWIHYVFKLRRAGIVIQTIDETHGGPFSGTHARYVLRSEVEILCEQEAEAA